jgi:hypothetical protein
LDRNGQRPKQEQGQHPSRVDPPTVYYRYLVKGELAAGRAQPMPSR